MGGRIQVQTEDVADFLDRLRIVGELERHAPMRRQPERVPNAADGRVRGPWSSPSRKCSVRRPARRRFQRANHHVLHLLVRDRPLGPGARLIIEPVQSMRDESPSPLTDRTWRDAQAPRHATTLLPVPSAHARMMRARRAQAAADRDRWASESNRCRSSVVKINATLGVPFACSPPGTGVRAGRAICFIFYGYRTLSPAHPLQQPRRQPRHVGDDEDAEAEHEQHRERRDGHLQQRLPEPV